MNKDFEDNSPDFTRRKKILKVILFLLLISLIILVVQLFLKENLFYFQENFKLISYFAVYNLLILYIIIRLDLYVSTKRIKESKKVEVPNEFRVDAFKQTGSIILHIIVLIIFVFIVVVGVVAKVGIFAIIFGLFGTGIIFYFLSIMIKRKKYSLEAKNRNIKIFYKNREIRVFEIKDISFVAFSGSGRQKVKRGDYPIMEICSIKGEKILKIPLSLKNYWILKKYFLKYGVDIEDSYSL